MTASENTENFREGLYLRVDGERPKFGLRVYLNCHLGSRRVNSYRNRRWRWCSNDEFSVLCLDCHFCCLDGVFLLIEWRQLDLIR